MAYYNHTKRYKTTTVQQGYTYTFKDGYTFKSKFGPIQYGRGQLDYLAHEHGGGYTVTHKV